MSKETPKVLKKPVHPKMLEKPRIRELHDAGSTPPTLVGMSLPKDPPLPRPVVEHKSLRKFNPLASFNPPAGAQNVRRSAVVKAKLRVIHDNVVSPPAPCVECKTAACCSAFVVGLSKAEYDSGLYDPHAIKLTQEMTEQLRGRLLAPSVLGGPYLHNTEDTYFYLEGRVGQPCPFLQEDKRCGIYEVRPVVCRIYSCNDDPRITEGMRAGTEPILLSDEWSSQKRGQDD